MLMLFNTLDCLEWGLKNHKQNCVTNVKNGILLARMFPPRWIVNDESRAVRPLYFLSTISKLFEAVLKRLDKCLGSMEDCMETNMDLDRL